MNLYRLSRLWASEKNAAGISFPAVFLCLYMVLLRDLFYNLRGRYGGLSFWIISPKNISLRIHKKR